MRRAKRIAEWATNLTADQMRDVFIELVDYAIDAEMVGFHDEYAPYWEHTGEPLIAGQETHGDD